MKPAPSADIRCNIAATNSIDIMRFSTFAISTAVVATNSAPWGEGRRNVIDSNLPEPKDRRTGRRIMTTTFKPIWENLEDPSIDIHASTDEGKECELDVGILECGMDQVCVPNTQSKRGGVCQSILWEQNTRELQDNTLFPVSSSVGDNITSPGQAYYMELCQYQYTENNCDCTKFDNMTFEGEISCTYERCKNFFLNQKCISTSTYYVEKDSITFSYCLEASAERFCFSLKGNFTTYETACIAASMNGCECDCELTPTGCPGYNETGRLFSCPNNVTSDGCNGYGYFFGNKIESCDISSFPINNSHTTSPTKSPATPVMPATEEPSASTVDTSTSSFVKVISISIGGLVFVVAIIIAFFFVRKRKLRPGGYVAATDDGHGLTPIHVSEEPVEAVPISSSSNVFYLPPPTTPASTMDQTIEVTAIVEPGNSDLPANFGKEVRKNVLPSYKDQVRSAVPELADMGDVEAIPSQP